MKANAWHHRADAVSSFVALIGVGKELVNWIKSDLGPLNDQEPSRKMLGYLASEFQTTFSMLDRRLCFSKSVCSQVLGFY